MTRSVARRKGPGPSALALGPLAPDPAGELKVLGLDCHPLGVHGAQVRVLEKCDLSSADCWVQVRGPHPEFRTAAARGYRTRLSGRISRCSLRTLPVRINEIRHHENGPAPGNPAHMDGKQRHMRHYLQRFRNKPRKIRDTMRRNTHPKRGDKEHGGHRGPDACLRSAMSTHEPSSRNFQDTILAQTPNPRRDEVSL